MKKPANFTATGGNIYFMAYDGGLKGSTLWKSDGTSSGTQQVKYTLSKTRSSYVSNVRAGKELYFTTNGTILWRSDGTGNGSIKVKDFSKSGYQNLITNVTCIDSLVYFSFFEGKDSTELWRSDGTLSGTTMVMKFLSSQYCGVKMGCYNKCGIISINKFGNKLLIVAADSTQNENSLFLSDGTFSGTARIAKKIESNIVVDRNIIYFNCFLPSTGIELWRSDGTKSGTYMIKDIWPGNVTSYPTNFKVIDGILYFSADDGSHGMELWRSDGTADGTWLIKDINTAIEDNRNSGSYPVSFTKYKGNIYFYAYDKINGNELWKTDGTQNSSSLVKNIDNSSGSSIASELFSNMTGLYFFANDRKNGTELWKSDGTEDGTTMVKDIIADVSGTNVNFSFIMDSVIYFTYFTPELGQELWISDGTKEGTNLVMDINPGPANPSIALLTYYKKALYFSADDGIHGEELWRMDIPYSLTTTADSIQFPEDSVGILTDLPEADNGEFPRIFPNPNDGNFTVQLDKSKPDNYTISIMNSLGFKINSVPFKTSDHEICFDMSGENSGIYYLQVDYNGKRTTKRIIKH